MNKLMSTLCALVASAMTFSAAAPTNGGMLVFGKSADARLLDPGCMDENNSVMIANNVFESLLAFKPGTTQLVPCLAKSLPTFSKDKLEISFTLRQGVKFHDGTSMDADAVIFSLLRQNDTTSMVRGSSGVRRAGQPPIKGQASSRTLSRSTTAR